MITGSDELFDFYCQPCSTDNLNVEAAGFCQQCQEYLCDTCCIYHRKSTTSKHHKIQDKTAMPKTAITPRVTDALTETCPKHTGKVLEYFCNDHGEICCTVCLNIVHGACKSKSYVPDVSDGAAKSQEYNNLVEELDRLVDIATSEQMEIKLNDEENEECCTKALANIYHRRKEMDTIVDQIMDEAAQNVTSFHKKNADEIKTAEQTCRSVLSNIETITTDLTKKKNANKNNQLFVDMKLTKFRLSAIEKRIQDLSDHKYIHYKFDNDDKLQELRSTCSATWALSLRKREGVDTIAQYLKEINAKSSEDENECIIEGVAAVSGYLLVVVDSNNTAVKLVDVRENKVTSRLTLSSKPGDVTRMAHNSVAVALGMEQKIEIFAVSDVLSKHHTINVPGTTFSSLCCMNDDGDKVLVLSSKPCVVKTVDMSGKVLDTVYKDNDTIPLFKFPRYITLSRRQELVYITDIHADTVTTMNSKGRIISVYRHDMLKKPRGIAVGIDGAVYVCSGHTRTVHQLSATGQHVNVLLDDQRGLETYPRAIAYDKDGSKLYISSGSENPEKCNCVRLFQLQ